jgi:hypothetical protein
MRNGNLENWIEAAGALRSGRSRLELPLGSSTVTVSGDKQTVGYQAAKVSAAPGPWASPRKMLAHSGAAQRTARFTRIPYVPAGKMTSRTPFLNAVQATR